MVSKRGKILILLTVDILIVTMSYLLTYIFKYGVGEGVLEFKKFFPSLPIFIGIYIVTLIAFKMYKSILKTAGIDEGIKGIISGIVGGALSFFLASGMKNLNPMISLGSSVLILILLVCSRMSIRVIRRLLIYREIKCNENLEKVIIIGAGSLGGMVSNEIIKNIDLKMKAVAFVDDNKFKKGRYINGIEVKGKVKNLPKLVEEYNVKTVILAINDISSGKTKEILEICEKTKAKIKIVPGIQSVIDGRVSLSKMRSVDIKDLLGREEVKLDKTQVNKFIKGKRILVTGGGGSIGSELCRQIAEFNPEKLYILDIYENNAYDLQNELKIKFPKLNQRVLIASVRDKKRLSKIFKEENIDIVFHAAAHKHVPLMEDNPEEAIKNNVLGTLNVAECANEYGAKRFVLISTDKAVNPTNVMGATKRLCEMIVQGMNKVSNTEYVAVRFGNVLGSNGSVIPLFKRQIKSGGPITLTHKDIIRYFMLIPEAAQLVLQAGAFAKGGEIFVLDMGEPVKIYDLAERLIKLSGFTPHKDIKIEVTGLRPGEKLFEELLMNEEGLVNTGHEKIFIGVPSEINIMKLKVEIENLLDVAVNKDKESLKREMKKVVPTFIEPGMESTSEIAN